MEAKREDPTAHMIARLEGIVRRRHPITITDIRRDLDLTRDEAWQAILDAPSVDVTWRRVSGRMVPYAVPLEGEA